MEYAILAFVAVFLLISSALLLLFHRDALDRRLSGIIGRRRGPGLLERFRFRQASESADGIANAIRKTAPAGKEPNSPVRRRLVFAGYRRDVHVRLFSISKLMAPLFLGAIVAVTGLYHWNVFLAFAAALGVGYLLPDFWLDHRIKARESAIQRGLPDLLDLMVVCLEAGLSVDQATIRSSEEMRPSHPAIADELGLVMLEVRAGQSRVVAWKHLMERSNVEAVRMLVTILVQADQFGTGISRTLRAHSETMRTHRKRKAEELAAKTSVKLVMPLALFVLPSFFVIVLGPAIITLSEVMSKH